MKKRNLFMSATLMCGCCSLAFNLKNNEWRWFWANNKPVGIIMATAAIVFAVLWIKAARKLNAKNFNA